METPSEVNWPESVWREINDGVLKEINKVRVAQKIFPTTMIKDNPDSVQDEIINFADLSIKEGATKPFVELIVEFPLTSTQVKQETEKHTCRTLARMAAKELALAEDTYFFQISDRTAKRDPDPKKSDVDFTPNVEANNWRTDSDLGLLAEANPTKTSNDDPNLVTAPIEVFLSDGGNAKWGENTFNAVADAIAKLVSKAQAPSYALILPTEVYADTFVPPSPASLVISADRIKPLVEGGFYSTGVLPKREGMVAALAGEPIKLYVGHEASIEFVRKEGARYFFKVSQRVQYVVRDPRALVLLRFQDKKKGQG
jgi:uncharacterized linocin/CFP29 family protein